MEKIALVAGSVFACLSVAIGAFGAHALKSVLEASERTDTFNTAVSYQFYHSLALLIIGLLMFKTPHKYLHYAAWLHIGGILLFSGSLYILCLSNNAKWGAVTPIGGVLFIAGWIFLAIGLIKSL